MLTEEQHKDYNTFKGLILDIIPELLTNKIVKSEYYLKCIFLKKKNTEPTPETTMWDFIYNLDKFSVIVKISSICSCCRTPVVRVN